MGESKFETGATFMVDLPRIHDPRGDLTPIEGGKQIPFGISRVYYLYNVPVDAERGGHAHKECRQLLLAISGSFRVVVDNGSERKQYWLRDPQKGLYIGRMVWRELDSFSQGAVSMVLASDPYDAEDYHRNYEQFLKAAQSSG